MDNGYISNKIVLNGKLILNCYCYDVNKNQIVNNLYMLFNNVYNQYNIFSKNINSDTFVMYSCKYNNSDDIDSYVNFIKYLLNNKINENEENKYEMYYNLYESDRDSYTQYNGIMNYESIINIIDKNINRFTKLDSKKTTRNKDFTIKEIRILHDYLNIIRNIVPNIIYNKQINNFLNADTKPSNNNRVDEHDDIPMHRYDYPY